MKKLFPFLLFLVGLGAGGGAALVFFPPEPISDASTMAAETTGPSEFVKFNNQFVVPVVHKGRVDSMVVLSISLEVSQGTSTLVYGAEPKLRDLILQELFNHANHGGFAGTFTNADQMERLRASLQYVAGSVLGKDLRGVLITDIARQDGA